MADARDRQSLETADNGGIVMHPVSRRAFVAGAAATAAVAATASLAATGCSRDDEEEFTPISATDADIIDVREVFAESTAVEHVTVLQDIVLPKGSLVWANSAVYAATMIQGETAHPLATAGVTSLSGGNYTELLSKAAGADEGFDIYDVRCSDSIFVWTELNYLHGNWRVYAATFTGASIGAPVQLDEGDSDYDPAHIAAAGQFAVWVVQPSTTGEKTKEDTLVKSQSLSSPAPTVIYTSHGRLGASPHVSGGVLTIAPRVNTSGVYYKMLACDPATGAEVASSVLPRSMRPLDVLWTGSGFAFAVEASYDSIAGIGGYGVYLQQGDKFLKYSRIPLDGMVMIGGNLVCKVGTAVSVIDIPAQQYYAVNLVSGCEDYGDIFATEATADQLAVYCTAPQSSSGIPVAKVEETEEDEEDWEDWEDWDDDSDSDSESTSQIVQPKETEKVVRLRVIQLS